MTTRLFVFGCSYATGEEILMHELGELDEYRKLTAKDPRKFFNRLEKLNLKSKYEEIRFQQKQLAWPQILADLLNYDCKNLAESGNSLDKILYQIYSEIYDGHITDKDLILVSLTKASRNAYFNNSVESFQLPSLYWPTKSLMGVKDTGDVRPVINEKTDIALLDWFTDDRISWDFVKNLQALKNIKQFFNLQIIPAMSNNLTTNLPLISKIYNECQKGFLTDKGLDDFSTERHAWGHPIKEAHIRYANHLYEILR